MSTVQTKHINDDLVGSQVAMTCFHCGWEKFHIHRQARQCAAPDEVIYPIYCANEECGEEYIHLIVLNPEEERVMHPSNRRMVL